MNCKKKLKNHVGYSTSSMHQGGEVSLSSGEASKAGQKISRKRRKIKNKTNRTEPESQHSGSPSDGVEPKSDPKTTQLHFDDDLRRTIKDENEFVHRLVNTIPPSVYFDAKTLEQINAQKHTMADEKLQVTGVKRHKQLSKKAKFQRTKMDPEQQRSVTDIQELLAKLSDDDDDDDDGDVLDNPVLRPTSSRSNSIEELRQRLQNKLASFRGGKACLNMSDAQEKKRLHRRMLKLKKKNSKLNKDNSSSIERKLTKKVKTKTTPARPVFNKDGKMVFSKFDFTESGVAADAMLGSNKIKKGEYSGKDYKKLLSKVQRDKEKLDELREKDEEKARIVQEKTAWKIALNKAEGVKVKTDPDLLKKALKRKEYRKKKTERKWNERTEQVQRRQEVKQKKRHDNIVKRKKDKIKGKMKKAVKRGRLVPGFS